MACEVATSGEEHGESCGLVPLSSFGDTNGEDGAERWRGREGERGMGGVCTSAESMLLPKLSSERLSPSCIE